MSGCATVRQQLVAFSTAVALSPGRAPAAARCRFPSRSIAARPRYSCSRAACVARASLSSVPSSDEDLLALNAELDKLSEVRDVLRDETLHLDSNLPCDRGAVPRVKVPVRLRTEDRGDRCRNISGCVDIPSSPARLWALLTSYDRLQLFVPNVLSCDAKPIDGQLFLDQTLLISRKLRIRSSLRCKVYEDRDRYSVAFKQTQGRDFQTFIAKYSIVQKEDNLVQLKYRAVIVPFPLYPMSLVEYKIAKELPGILTAIRYEAVVGKHVPIE